MYVCEISFHLSDCLWLDKPIIFAEVILLFHRYLATLPLITQTLLRTISKSRDYFRILRVHSPFPPIFFLCIPLWNATVFCFYFVFPSSLKTLSGLIFVLQLTSCLWISLFRTWFRSWYLVYLDSFTLPLPINHFNPIKTCWRGARENVFYYTESSNILVIKLLLWKKHHCMFLIIDFQL